MIPPEIAPLLESGIWPRDHRAAGPAFSEDRVRALTDGDEWEIHLYPPPFRTLAKDVRDNPWWAQHAALNEVHPETCLILGEFGYGADAAFIVELREPRRVLRLQWTGQETHWVVWADSLSELLDKLGLA